MVQINPESGAIKSFTTLPDVTSIYGPVSFDWSSGAVAMFTNGMIAAYDYRTGRLLYQKQFPTGSKYNPLTIAYAG